MSAKDSHAAGMRAYLRQGLATGVNWVEREAAGIERRIPHGCRHQSAIEALRCIALAREAATEAKQAYWIVHAMAAIKDYQLFDDAVLGEKFRAGGKRNRSGAIRRAIARLLKSDPGMVPAELWDAIAAKPPSGHDFYKQRDRLIEGPNRPIKYSTFRNIVSMEKGKIKPYVSRFSAP